AGAIPLSIRVVDPLGRVRYDLHRATEQGLFRMTLPLAANDPAGAWTVVVRELLSDSEGTAAFAFAPAPQCAALAGAVDRPTSYRTNLLRADSPAAAAGTWPGSATASVSARNPSRSSRTTRQVWPRRSALSMKRRRVSSR